MDPYIQATFSRGEGFIVDDIDNLDQFGREQYLKSELRQERWWGRVWKWVVGFKWSGRRSILGRN